MVAMTWNIHTSEGRGAIAAMLERQLPHVRPQKWRIDGPSLAEIYVIYLFNFNKLDFYLWIIMWIKMWIKSKPSFEALSYSKIRPRKGYG